MPDIATLKKTLRVELASPDLLERALVHSSYVNENPAFVAGHNERLEFLGDAVLDCIMAEKLYRDLPGSSEGSLTRLRAGLVRRNTLAAIARDIKLGDFLLMGKGEEASGGRDNAHNLAGSLEAVIAAIYLDQGLTAAAELVHRLFKDAWTKVVRDGTDIDYKSRLQEVAQSRWQLTPSYRLITETGPDHDKTFTVEVMAGSRSLGTGTGKSKKLAEAESARKALALLGEGFTG
jgi:ribonuclease-3